MGVIVPRSSQSTSVAPVVGRPQIQAEDPGIEGAVRGLAQGTAAIADIGEKIRRQEDEARVTDALNLAERQWQTSLYASDKGLLQRRGVNALEGEGRKSVIDDGLERRGAILEDSIGTLTTERQRTALKSAWAARERFAVDSLQRHMDRERDVYQDSVDDTSIAIQQEALTLAQNDTERAVALAGISGKAQEIADRKGLAPEAADVLVREFTSPALESAIATMARTDPEGARKLFEDKRDFIKADRFEAIGKKIEVEGVTLQSQQITEQAFAANPGASLAQVQKWLRANTSGAVQDDALSRSSARWQVEERARRDAREGSSNGLDARVWNFATGSHSPQEVELERDALMRSIRDQGLDLSDGAALLSSFDKLTAGKPVKTDEKAWSQLWNIRTKDAETFRDMELAPWRAHFTREDFNELQSEQKDLRSGGKGLSTSPSGLGALAIAKKIAAEINGVEGTDWEATYAVRAHRAIVSAQEAQPDRALTWKEKEDAALSVLDEITVPDAGVMFFDGTKRIGELTAKDRKALEAEVPADLAVKVRSELAARGIANPTDEQIREAVIDFLDVYEVPRE